MSPLPDYDLGTARGVIDLDASSLGRAEAAFMGLGKGLLGFSALAVGGFAYVVKAAADFEHIMSAVEAVSGASVQQMEQLKARALEIGSSSVFSADEVGRAMEQLAKAGISVEDMLGGATEATVNLAAAAGDELPGGVDRAAEVIANAMKTFDAGADSMDHFANVIVGAAASSTVNVDDLATTLSYAGPIAHELGLSIDDLSTAVAILGDRGIKGSTAGTSLRGVLLSLTPSSTKARNAMQDLGLITADGTNRFYDMNGALKPLPEVMEILKESTQGLSEQQKVSAFNAIFQRRAMNSALIMADAGAAGFDQYAAAIAGIDASDVAATKIDNLTGDMTILKNSLDALIITVGMEFQDMMRGWVQGLTDVVHWLQTLDPVMLANILKAIAFAGAIAGLLGGLSLFIGVAIRMYRNFKLLAEGIKLVMGAMRLLSASLLTNPWFLLIAALVALGLVLYDAYKNSNDFRIAVDGAFQAIKAVVMPIIDTLVQGVRAFIEVLKGEGTTGSDGFIGMMERIGQVVRDTGIIIWGFIQDIRPALQAFFGALSGGGTTGSDGFIGFMERAGVLVRELAIWLINVGIPALIEFGKAAFEVGKIIVEHVAGAIEWFINNIVPKIIWFADEVGERIVSAFVWVQDNIWPVLYAIGELIVALVDKVLWLADKIGGVISFFLPIFTAIITGFENMLTIVKGVITGGIEAIQIIWGLFGDNLFDAIELVWNLIKGVIEAVLDIIKGIIQTVTGIITGDWDKAWEGIKNIVEGIWGYIQTIVQTAIDAVKLIIETFIDTIRAGWELFWNAVKTTVETIITIIKNTIEGTLNTIKEMWENVWQAIGDFLSGAWDWFYETILTKGDDILQFFFELPGNILEKLGDLLALLFEKGTNLVSGLLNGINSIVQSLWNFFIDLPGEILEKLGDLGSILFDIGKDIINGLWNGMKNMWDRATGWLGGLGGAIVDLKGPPEKDRVLLTDNGRLIMQSLMDGLQSEYPTLQRMLNSIAPMIQSKIDVPSTVIAANDAAARSQGDVNISFAFTGVTAADAQAIKSELMGDRVLDNIVVAVRAGARG